MDKQAAGYVGAQGAPGFSVNCAWSDDHFGDAEYVALWEQLVLPVAREFAPDLILVSAGFDSGAGDEEGYLVTPAGYAALLEALHAVCPAIVVVLEGGYNVPTISHSLHACVAALLGVVRLATGGQRRQCKPQALDDIAATVAAQRPYWACLRAEA